MEEHVRPGLLHLAGTDVKKWRELETLDELHLPTDKPVRLLLFIHGTFSSTVGGFGALGIDKKGKGFLRTAISAYDAVIGFDHKTLSLDPQAERPGPADPAADTPPRGRARHRHRHAQPWRTGDAIVHRAAASRLGLAGQGRQRRLRRVHQRGHASRRPEALERPRRPLHEPGGGRCERARDGAGCRARRRRGGWGGEGDRGVREVPRVVRRQGRRRARSQGDGPGWRIRRGDQQDPAGTAGAGDELVRRLLELPRRSCSTTATTRRSSRESWW